MLWNLFSQKVWPCVHKYYFSLKKCKVRSIFWDLIFLMVKNQTKCSGKWNRWQHLTSILSIKCIHFQAFSRLIVVRTCQSIAEFEFSCQANLFSVKSVNRSAKQEIAISKFKQTVWQPIYVGFCHTCSLCSIEGLTNKLYLSTDKIPIKKTLGSIKFSELSATVFGHFFLHKLDCLLFNIVWSTWQYSNSVGCSK